MQFLKKKAVSFYEYSKNMMKKSNEEEADGKQLLELLLTQQVHDPKSMAHQKLAKLSMQFHEYTQIFNALIIKLEPFAYRSKMIKESEKLLNLVCFLIQSGSQQFAKDFKKNEDLFINFEKINTHQFQNIYMKNAKQLTYSLELIRHRASYARKLINNSKLLEEEREKAKTQSFIQDVSKLDNGDQTINGLKINNSFDKSPAKKNPNKSLTVEVTFQKQNQQKQETDCELTSSKPQKNKKNGVSRNKISNQVGL